MGKKRLVAGGCLTGLLLMTVVYGGGCGDDTTEPGDPLFSLQLTVVDPAQDPVPDLQVSIWSRITLPFDDRPLGDPKPASIFTFQIPVSCRVAYSLYDVTGRLACTLVDEVLPAGTHRVRWDGWFCEAGESPRLQPGPYRAVMQARDTDSDDLLFEGEIVGVMFLIDPARMRLGATDAAGTFRTDDEARFPHLYMNDTWEPFLQVDENGDLMGTFRYTGEVRIALVDTLAHLMQSYDLEVGAGPNRFTLTWDPRKAETGIKSANDPPSSVGPVVFSRRDEDKPPALEFEMRQNYPNPFN